LRHIELSSLLASRICHDLISPLGAIGNGVELLVMSGVAAGPELSLISESVANANARIRFFRIAFGAAAPGQMVGRGEIVDILTTMTRSGRLTLSWQADGEVERREVKLAFLCLQCLESALPWGGRITVARRDERWTLTADSTKLRELDRLWAAFDAGAEHEELGAGDIQFVLAPLWAQTIGRRLTRAADTGRLTIQALAA
jgi:histidine phosphotransferase ChpT